ncbi:MAG: B12-binding domain-containing radical SAM protein [Candidatus Moduliflexus flocculans]|nr:B12-binding domain-containing radical SAM protein [Candidatus Moduliflexus flocculans]
MPKMVFIEPRAPNLHIFSAFPLPRLGALILGTMMKERGWDVEVYVEDLRRIDYDAVAGADLVGISTITSTAPRAYAIADKARAMGRTVLMGGPHVTFLAEEALEHADFVFRGEGERPLTAFVEAWESGLDPTGTPNLSFRAADGRIVHNPLLPMERDLDRIPYPDLSLLKPDPRRRKFQPPIPVQTSRGCPFACSFCSVTGMFGKKYRFRSTENVIEELRRYDRDNNAVFFYDDNFAADRERTKELLEAMIREGFKFRVDDPGPGRFRPRHRARRADEGSRLPHGVHRLRVGQSPEPRRHEEEADRGRSRPGRPGPPPAQDQHPRHVRSGIRRGRLAVRQGDGQVRQEIPAVHDPVPHPDAPARVGVL